MLTQVKEVSDKIRSRLAAPSADPLMARLKVLSSLTLEDCFATLDSHSGGLPSKEAAERQTRYGLNEAHHEKAPSWYRRLLDAFINPFIGILLVIALVSLVMGDAKTVTVVSIMVLVSALRMRRVPIIQSWATAPVLALTTLIMPVGVFLPFSPLASTLKMEALPLAYFPWLIGILVMYCFLTQIVKDWFIRKFDQWL